MNFRRGFCTLVLFIFTVLVSVDEVLQPDVESHHVKFGSQVALNCSHENTADVKWYINEEEISGVSTSSSLLEFVFSNAGVYKCEVTDQLENYVKSVRLCGVGKCKYVVCAFVYKGVWSVHLDHALQILVSMTYYV